MECCLPTCTFDMYPRWWRMSVDMLITEGGEGNNFPDSAHLFIGETQGGLLTQVTPGGMYESMHIYHKKKIIIWKK